MSVYPLPLNVVPAHWQDNGSRLYPIADRDVAIIAGKKFYLGSPTYNTYLECPLGGINAYVNGVLQAIVWNGIYTPQDFYTNSGSKLILDFTGGAKCYLTHVSATDSLEIYLNSANRLGITKEGAYSQNTITGAITYAVDNIASRTTLQAGASSSNYVVGLRSDVNFGIGVSVFYGGYSGVSNGILSGNNVMPLYHGHVGEVDVYSGSVVGTTDGVVGATYLTGTGEVTDMMQGVMGYAFVDKTVDATKPTKYVCGLSGIYMTPGISLTSTFSLGTENGCRAGVVSTIYDDPNTIPKAAYLAFVTGTGAGPVLPAAFKAVDARTAGGKGWAYGLDLFKEAGLNNGIATADIRGHAGNTLKNLAAGTWESDAALKATGLTLGIVTKAFIDTGYTATNADYTILGDAALGAVVLNLPTAVGIAGKLYNFKKVDATGNAITVTPNGAETIDGAPNKALAVQWASVTIQSDGANWLIL